MTTPNPQPTNPPPGQPTPYGAAAPPPAGYPAASYAPAGWNPPPPAASSSTSTTGRGLAITSIILGSIPLILSLFMFFVFRAIRLSGSYEAYQVAYWISDILSAAVGVGAIVCGALARREQPLLGGIGIGLGIAATVSTLISLMFSVVGYI